MADYRASVETDEINKTLDEILSSKLIEVDIGSAVEHVFMSSMGSFNQIDQLANIQLNINRALLEDAALMSTDDIRDILDVAPPVSLEAPIESLSTKNSVDEASQNVRTDVYENLSEIYVESILPDLLFYTEIKQEAQILDWPKIPTTEFQVEQPFKQEILLYDSKEAIEDYYLQRPGDASVSLPSQWNYITGTPQSDWLNGTQARDYMLGLESADVMMGGLNDDYMDGGSGSDKLYGESGHDVIYGGEGDDYLDGGLGHDYLDGGEGNDQLYDLSFATNENNILHGGPGDDELTAIGNGHNELYGGEGRDILYASGGGNHTSYGGEGNDTLYASGAGLNQLFGGSGNDFFYVWNNSPVKMYGEQGDDRMHGGEGSDVIDGGSGNDLIYGHQGDDVLIGGAGFDRLYGHEGNDIFIFGVDSHNDVVDGGSGLWTDTIELNIFVEQISQVSANQWVLHSQGGNSILTADHHYDIQTSSFDGSANGFLTMFDGSLLEFYDIENLAWSSIL